MLEWHRLAESIARAWESWLPRTYGSELARNALHPLAMGGVRGEHALYESVLAAIAHRRDVLREPTYLAISDAVACTLASLAAHLYEWARRDAALVERASHVLLGIECRRVSDRIWCGRSGPIVLYLRHVEIGEWQVAIGDAGRDYGVEHTLASGTGVIPEAAALHAFSRVPSSRRECFYGGDRESASDYRYQDSRAREGEPEDEEERARGEERAEEAYRREHSAARLGGVL